MATVLSTPEPSTSVNRSASLRLQRATSLDEVDQLERPWRELARPIGNPTAQFDWTRAGLSAFSADIEPRVISAHRDEQIVAVAPLVSKRLHGIRRLFFAGLSELFEPMDFVWSEEHALERLLASLVRGGSPLLLERIAADSLSLQKLKRAYRGRAIVLTRHQATCFFIALDESWLEPEQHLNSGRRSDLRRAKRKAEQLGPVTTEFHTPDLYELPQLLDTCFEVEAKSWEGKAGTALAHDAHRAVFYRQFAQAACVEGVLRIALLRIGDRVAAMQLFTEQGGGLWLLKVGYDAHFAQCSPGLLLMRETIRYAVEAGLNSYEFLGRPESWTEVWTKTEQAYVSVRVYPFGVRGLAALVADAAVAIDRKWSKK